MKSALTLHPCKTIAATLAAILIACVSAPAPAQTRPAADPDVALKRIETATGQLDLTDGQRTQIAAILKQASDELTNAGPDLQNASTDEKTTKYREILADAREQVAGVLTDDQKQQLREKVQSLRENGNDRASAGAATMPTSQPATIARAGNGRGGQGRGAQMLDRFKSALGQLDLNADQKDKTSAVLDDMAAQIKEIRQSVRSGNTNRDELREKVTSLLQDTRSKISAILTPDQQQKLRSILQDTSAGNNRSAPDENAKTPATQPAATPATLPAHPGESTAAVSTPQAVALDLGQPAPDFDLKRIDGQKVSLAAFKHRVAVIVFASISAPAFRDHAAGLNALHEKYATRGVEFLVIYGREQHPVGGWELQRNKDENINIPLAKSVTDRETAARQLHDALHLSVPVAIDSMDDHVAGAYGVNQTVPAFVIDRDGNIAFRQSWLEPASLAHALDDALATKN